MQSDQVLLAVLTLLAAEGMRVDRVALLWLCPSPKGKSRLVPASKLDEQKKNLCAETS